MSSLHPSFMIIGERKCGTSSLYRYLITHPNVLPAKRKETAFFSNSLNYIKGHQGEYLSFFPDLTKESTKLNWIELSDKGELYEEELIFPIEKGRKYITGEASANVFSTVNPAKVHALLPKVKLIIMVREPMKRAISQHKMYQRYKSEGRKWSWLLGSLKRDLTLERLAFKLGSYSGPFLGPGYYAHHLKKWLKYFPKKQFFIIQTEDLEEDESAKKVMSELCTFLDLPQHDFSSVMRRKYNKSNRKNEAFGIHSKMKSVFEKPNDELEALLGRKLDW